MDNQAETEETKECTNCKREIPSCNFLVHSVHCGRHIKLCPVCKEPVPISELDAHHESLHSLLPCKLCGEDVCGTDLEDHVRDSCAHTMQNCKYCSLAVRRGSLPQHEGYCAARTERCECGAWVMAQHRDHHLITNHGDVAVDGDDQTENARNKSPQKPWQPLAQTAGSKCLPTRPRLAVQGPGNKENEGFWETDGFSDDSRGDSEFYDPLSRSVKKVQNNIPQPARHSSLAQDSQTGGGGGGGAIRKQRPRSPPARDPRRELACERALQRRDAEDKQRREQTAYNLSVGLPPVLNPAEKLNRLRKMDALHNREAPPEDYKNCLQGRAWRSPEPRNVGHILGTGQQKKKGPNKNGYVDSDIEIDLTNDDIIIVSSEDEADELSRDEVDQAAAGMNQDCELLSYSEALQKQPGNNDESLELENQATNQTLDQDDTSYSSALKRHTANNDVNNNLNNENSSFDTQNDAAIIDLENQASFQNNSLSYSNALKRPLDNTDVNNQPSCSNLRNQAANNDLENQANKIEYRYDFRNLTAMSQAEFELRLQDIILRDQKLNDDRFSAIKTSLKELRRGLNDVTAPYSASSNCGNSLLQQNQRSSFDGIELPCEFCSTLIPASDLVLHQTGCRPDIACSTDRPDTRTDSQNGVENGGEPFIPCEFCSTCLPIYLITEHMEMCQREAI